MAMEKVRTPIIITGTAVPKTIKITTTTAIQTTMCHDFSFDPGDDQRHYHYLQSVVKVTHLNLVAGISVGPPCALNNKLAHWQMTIAMQDRLHMMPMLRRRD